MKFWTFAYLLGLIVAVAWFFTYALNVMSQDVDDVRARIEGRVHVDWHTDRLDI